MNTICKRAAAVFFVLVFPATIQASGADTGVVKGQINFCGKGGVDGMLVYIPGRQYSVVTGEDGTFIFDQLMPGEYRLKYKNGNRIFNSENSIYVFSQRVNDLGEVTLCDPAGTVISDTGQAPSVVKSAAPSAAVQKAPAAKVTEGGNCTEGTLVSIPGGTGECKNGKLEILSCNKGRSDCDGKLDNGCEINLLDDNENCGSCNNECSGMEICSMGIC